MVNFLEGIIVGVSILAFPFFFWLLKPVIKKEPEKENEHPEEKTEKIWSNEEIAAILTRYGYRKAGTWWINNVGDKK